MKIYTKKIAEELVESLKSIETKQKENDYIIKDIVMSTNEVDRHSEIIIQEWIDLTEFNKNPVALIDHNYSVENIAWVWFNIRQIDWKTIWDVRLVDTEAGNLIKTLHQAGAIKDVSIWFIVKERQWDVIVKLELLECSFVVIWANRWAKLKEIYWKDIFDWLMKLWIYEDPYPECVRPLEADGTVSEEEKTCRRKKRQEEKQNEELEEVKTILKSLTQEVWEIKKLLVDGKTISEADKEKKENLQTAVRAINDVLRDMKQK
jgi:phage head maturation protease